MNMPIKFDTLQYTRSLIEAGIPPDQAEAQAQALTQAMDEATVAPSELVLLRTDMIVRIEMLRTDMTARNQVFSSSGAVDMRTNSGATSRPSSNSRHIGIASENIDTASGGVTIAATTKAPTIA